MAANILDLSSKIKEAPLSFINYEGLQQSNAGFLRTDTWDFKFTKMAPATYFPGNDFMRTRVKGCTVNMEDGAISSLQADIRGFRVEQPIGTGSHNGTFSLEIQEFEDQSLFLWLWDWYTKIRDPKNNFSFSKSDIVADAELIVYSGQRIPIRKYTFKCCFPTTIGDWMNYNGTSDDASDAGQFTATFNCENIKVELLNH